MNPFFWPTLGLAVALFWIGQRLYSIATLPRMKLVVWLVAVAVALPGLLFVLYYTKLLGEPLWLYRFRAVPGSELTAAGLGLLAGSIQGFRASSPRLKRWTSRFGIPVFFAFALCVPHLKPVLRPLHLPASPNNLSEGVCRQSSPSTCGPASAVTLAHLAGIQLNEHELARVCYTSAGGTENWYLARALHARGLHPQFLRLDPASDHLPCPAIAGVKLRYATGTGHFIPILAETDGLYEIGDPMRGRETLSLTELRDLYDFTGFFMIVK